MAARREITKRFAREYARADRVEKGRLLDALVETTHELRLLNELHGLVMKRKNFLLPCVKATGWTHTTSGRKKRVYDAPRTPYQRLLDADVLDAAARAALEAEHAKLNPAAITRRITRIQRQLIDLAAARTQGTRPAA